MKPPRARHRSCRARRARVAARGRRRRSTMRERPAACGARARPRPTPRFDLVGLHWRGLGERRVPHARGRRRLDAAVAAPAGRRRPRPRRRVASSATRLGRLRRRDPLPDRGHGDAGCARTSSGARAEELARAPSRASRARRRSSRAPRGTPTSRSAARRRTTRARIHFAIVHHTAGSNNYTPRSRPRSCAASRSTT